MSVIAYTMARPHDGKRAKTEERARRLGDIYSKHGVSVKLANVISGPNMGCIALIRGYANFTAAATAFQAINADPANVEFWREREADPAGDIVVGRDILRTVYGKHRWDTHPISLIRQYEITRDNIAAALELLTEVEELVSKANVNVAGMVPVTGENLSSMSISYQFSSIDEWGAALDTVGTSDEFQALVAKAATLGNIRGAFMMTPL